MFKLMIADDNNFILQDLSQNVDWERFDLDLLGTYSDGQELLTAAREQTPDVVITDIVMPVINGFELTSLLYELNPQVKVIFISGHTEFEYATNALKLHVFDYVIKPIQHAQLAEIMTRVLSVLHQEQEQTLLLSETQAQLTHLRKTSLSHYISRLLFYPNSESQIRRELASLGLILPRPFELYVVCFRLQNAHKDELSDAFIYSVTEQDTPDTILPLIIEKGQGALLLIYSNQTLTVSDVLAKFCIDVETRTKCSITVGGSEPTTHFSELPQIYKQAYRTLKQMLQSETNIPIAFYNDICLNTREKKEEAQSSPYSETVASMRAFIKQNYMTPISAADVAKSVYLSTGHANLCFTNECNISIFGYIIWYRIKIAKQLLTETDLHVAHIAERVGYNSKTSFYLAFKRSTGISPTEYRQQHS